MPAPEKRGALVTRDACVAGGAIGYAIHAGAIDLLPIVALSVVAIALVYGVTYGATWRMASDVFARLTTSVSWGSRSPREGRDDDRALRAYDARDARDPWGARGA